MGATGPPPPSAAPPAPCSLRSARARSSSDRMSAAIKGFELVQLAARDERRDDLEVRVLRGGADQSDDAVLHRVQQGVLLGFGEAVDLVDEEDGPPPGLRPAVAGLLDDLAHLGHAGTDGGELLVHGPDGRGHQPGDRGLAGAGRTEEDHRPDGAGLDRDAQRGSLAQKPALPHDLVQGARAHAGGQRGVLRQVGAQAGAEEIFLHDRILSATAAGVVKMAAGAGGTEGVGACPDRFWC